MTAFLSDAANLFLLDVGIRWLTLYVVLGLLVTIASAHLTARASNYFFGDNSASLQSLKATPLVPIESRQGLIGLRSLVAIGNEVQAHTYLGALDANEHGVEGLRGGPKRKADPEPILAETSNGNC